MCLGNISKDFENMKKLGLKDMCTIFLLIIILLILVILQIFVLGEGLTDVLDDTAITVEAKYSCIITKWRKKICLDVHYNATNNFLYANGLKIYQFKAKDSEIKPYPLYLGTDFTFEKMKKPDLRDICTIFRLIIILLTPAIL